MSRDIFYQVLGFYLTKGVVHLSEELNFPPSVVDEDEKAAEVYNRSRRGFFRILRLFILLMILWWIFTAISIIGSLGSPYTVILPEELKLR